MLLFNQWFPGGANFAQYRLHAQGADTDGASSPAGVSGRIEIAADPINP